jgi:glutamine amidotransferase
MITVVDYGRGNLFSISQALRHLGADYEITEDPARVQAAERIILPGVGAFGDAMDGLRGRGLVGPIKAAADRGVPMLGICLGMQLLLGRSEEFGDHEGLGLIPGTVKRLPDGVDEQGGIRIPNVGWRELESVDGDGYLADLAPETMMYFVHSYTPRVENPTHVAATIPVNGWDAASVISRGSVVGYQFHPEKSGADGLAMLKRFLDFEPN